MDGEFKLVHINLRCGWDNSGDVKQALIYMNLLKREF